MISLGGGVFLAHGLGHVSARDKKYYGIVESRTN